MATTPKLTGTIDIALHAIGAEADFLPELAAMWDEESPANRADWDIEWTDLMARLEDLEGAYRAGAMTAEQQERYCTLRRNLRAQLPLLERLGLSIPHVPLED